MQGHYVRLGPRRLTLPTLSDFDHLDDLDPWIGRLMPMDDGGGNLRNWTCPSSDVKMT